MVALVTAENAFVVEYLCSSTRRSVMCADTAVIPVNMSCGVLGVAIERVSESRAHVGGNRDKYVPTSATRIGYRGAASLRELAPSAEPACVALAVMASSPPTATLAARAC